MSTLPDSVKKLDLEFNHKNSAALCVGIDQYRLQSRGGKYYIEVSDLTKNDTEAMKKVFVNKLGFNDDRVKLHLCSEHSGFCSKDGLESSFIESVKMVQENGIFIFYYAGHGLRESADEYVLVISEHEKIFVDDLKKWLCLAKCKGKVLIILDCCYAGKIGKEITKFESVDFPESIDSSLFVMCACAADEQCTALGALEHSIFTYFLLEYLKNYKPENIGKLEVQQAMQHIKELCLSLTSLIMVDDSGEEIAFKKMCPELYEGIQPRSRPAMFYYHFEPKFKDDIIAERHIQLPEPHKKINEWLNSEEVQQSLSTLYKKSFTKILQHGIFCVMLYSSAVIQKKYEKRFLRNTYLFLKIANIVLCAIKCIHPEFEVDIDQLYEGFEYYRIPIKKVQELPEKHEMTRDYNALLSEKLIEVTINACD